METTALILFSTGVIVLLFTLYKFWYKQGNPLKNPAHHGYNQSSKDASVIHGEKLTSIDESDISGTEKKDSGPSKSLLNQKRAHHLKTTTD